MKLHYNSTFPAHVQKRPDIALEFEHLPAARQLLQFFHYVQTERLNKNAEKHIIANQTACSIFYNLLLRAQIGS